MNNATWLDIPGYAGAYQASRSGLVRSVNRLDSIGRPRKGRVLKLDSNHHGRLCVTLYLDGTRKTHKVHRLVALTFHGPGPLGHDCCHNDGNHLNNKADNLRWDTRSANQIDSLKHGTHGNQTLCEADVHKIRQRLAAGHKNTDISLDFGVSPVAISYIKTGRRWAWLENKQKSV